MKLIYKLFHLDPGSRDDVITATSGLGIAVNIIVASVKIVIGIITSSIAIISEGVNNATDALTSVLTLVGTKLAGKRPDEEHPFGYGRIEYLTGLVIAVIILVSGLEMLISSVKLIFRPEKLSISAVSLIIVAASAVIKLLLGLYTIRMGKKAGSSALEAVGIECRNDSFVSVLTIASALVFLIFHISIDAYAGVVISLIIVKSGADVLIGTVSELIGRAGEKEVAAKLYNEIRGTEGVLAAVDMILHNYGPDAYTGSVNLEMDHEKTVGEIYQVLHELQLRIMRRYNVVMVFGIYAVDNDHEEVKELRKHISAFVKSREHVKSFHALYLEPGTNRIYCDFIIDHKLRDWNGLRKEFSEYMAEKYRDNEIVLTLDTEFVGS